MQRRPAVSSVVLAPGVGADTLAAFRLLSDRVPPTAVLSAIAIGLVIIFVATVVLPLATYTIALALFGLAHVGSELRYVDHRFGARLSGGLVPWILAPLGLAVAARLASLAGYLAPATTVTTELALGAVMAMPAVVCMRRHRVAGAVVALTLAAGAVLAPFQTLLILAIAHNLTPLAFIADATVGRTRRTMLALLAMPFVALPLVIASGLPFQWLSAAGLVHPEVTPFEAGPLMANLGIYVPASLIDTPGALHIFSAAVFTQCMHYAVVIGLLPRLIDPASGANPTVLRWPSPPRFAFYLLIACALFAGAFLIDFGASRRVYALAAMVHSWIEIPILLLAFGLLSSQPQTVKQEADAG